MVVEGYHRVEFQPMESSLSLLIISLSMDSSIECFRPLSDQGLENEQSLG